MDASPGQLRAVLALVVLALAAVIAATVALVRRGRAVPFPDLSGGGRSSGGAGGGHLPTP